MYRRHLSRIPSSWHGLCTKPVELSILKLKPEVTAMKWETPAYNDIRFGFEVTMYINNK